MEQIKYRNKWKEDQIMPDVAEMKQVGLCSTCNNAAFCVYRAKRGFDATYCDMFDVYGVPTKGNGHGESDTFIALTEMKAKQLARTKYKGLCSNCENIDTCTLPKPEEGVWHCEEYE
jgi:hypothetical protein